MSQGYPRRFLIGPPIAMGMAVMALAATAADAQERGTAFDIPRESLSKALRDFGRSSGRELIFSEDLVAGRTAPPINGRYSATAALDRLLDGSGLIGVQTPAGVIMIEKRAPPAKPVVRPIQLEDIVVTAERRAEPLQFTPVSDTAFTSAELARRQIRGIHDLLDSTPGATFSATLYGNNDMIIAIRGVAPGGVLPNVDQATATYVDGLYYARPQMSNFALVDVARAEVLRGPQGTLFGRNSIGGALNITTNAPTDRFEGSASIGYGNDNRIEWTGVLNMPLRDGWATRFAVNHVSHDGYASDVALGTPVADQNDNFFRVTIRGDIVPRVKIQVTFDYASGSEHQPLWILDYLDPASAQAPLLSPYLNTNHARVSLADYNPINQSRAYDITAKVVADIGFATLTSITGYRDINDNGAADLTGAGVQISDVLTGSFVGGQFSEELQFAGDSADGKLHWVAGLYYFNERLDNFFRVASLSSINVADIKPNNSSASGFGQLTLALTPKTRLTGGVRYVYDFRSITYYAPHFALAGPTGPSGAGNLLSQQEGPQLPGAAGCPTYQAGLSAPFPCSYTPPSIHFGYMPWTLGLDYQPNAATFLYAKVSQGYRSGGFQQAGGTTRAQYKPFGIENVLSYELGAKLSLLKHRLTLDGAVYYSNYRQIQQNSAQIVNGQPLIAVLNAGAAVIDGGELEAAVLLGDLRLNASVGIVDPRFTSGPYKGSVVPTVAKQTFSISGDYPIVLDTGVLTLHAGYNYKSAVTFLNTINLNTTPSAPYSPAQIASVTQAGYGLLDARVSFALKTAPLTVAVWGRNLTNVFFAGRSGSYYSSNFNSIVVGDPATFGVSLTYAFGG